MLNTWPYLLVSLSTIQLQDLGGTFLVELGSLQISPTNAVATHCNWVTGLEGDHHLGAPMASFCLLE